MTEPSPIRRVAVSGADADVVAETSLSVGTVPDADAVIAVGEEALSDAALADQTLPVLPVGVEAGLNGVDRTALVEAAAALAAGNYRIATHPVLGIETGGERVGRAVFDVTLMTSEPARISEYSLSKEDEQLATVRADGIVVAASFGSAGYNNAAGGPLLSPGTGLSVVPVAPFTTRANGWVVPGPLDVAVERHEGGVSLFTDVEDQGAVAPHERVTVRTEGTFDCLRPFVE